MFHFCVSIIVDYLGAILSVKHLIENCQCRNHLIKIYNKSSNGYKYNNSLMVLNPQRF